MFKSLQPTVKLCTLDLQRQTDRDTAALNQNGVLVLSSISVFFTMCQAGLLSHSLSNLSCQGSLPYMLGHMCAPTMARTEIGPGLKADAGRLAGNVSFSKP